MTRSLQLSIDQMNNPEYKPPPQDEVASVVDRLFRHEAGKMISTITRIFGFRYINLAEDAVQEALTKALLTWPYYGIPDNPAAWITQVSKNQALDVIRREKVFRNKEAAISHFIEQTTPPEKNQDSIIFKNEFSDNTLWMMFCCCHPTVSRVSQVALALNTLCGFNVREISNAFLSSESAISRRLTRAKGKIRKADIPFDLPTGDELTERLDGVLQTLYLLFNEGYKSSHGENLVREELCHEAIRLATLLAEHPAGSKPKTHALLALMLLNGARLPARVDAEGNILRLKEQDRTLWDKIMISRGMYHLMRSTENDEISEYHLQAGIAATHCAAGDYESTDWKRILSLYDMLIEIDDSPVIALNRAVAIANIYGPGAGIKAVDDIKNRRRLNSYYLIYAVLGEFNALLGNREKAVKNFRRSLELVTIESERKFFWDKLQVLE